MYEKQIQQLRIIGRGLGRISKIRNHYGVVVTGQVKTALTKLSKQERETYNRLSGIKAIRWLVDNNHIYNSKHVDMYIKVSMTESAWQSRHEQITKALTVDLKGGFTVKTISRNKKGAMVTISHPRLKNNVTRHLRWVGNRLTGYAPFGLTNLITYDANSIDVEDVAIESAAA